MKKATQVILLCLTVFYVSELYAQEQSLFINEFVAQNSSYTDEFGELDDWVELYNAGDTEVDIGGMYVTDDLTDTTKWRIPSHSPAKTTIAPGGFLVLWFDNDSGQGVLHVDARLSADGEDIGLFDTDGQTLLDSITFGQQTENISYGRVTDGADSWKTFSNPTPGMSNAPDGEPALKEFFITCNPDSFVNIYDHYNEKIYITAALSYGGRTWNDTSMRIRNDSSRERPKKSLRIRFESLPYSNGRSTLIFNAVATDKSYMNEYLASRLLREAGLPAQEAEFARVYMNGEFLGLYLLMEDVDEDFLDANGLDNNGDLYRTSEDGACLSVFDDINYHWDKRSGASSGNTEFEQLIQSLDSVSDDDYAAFAGETFDYDNMITVIAVNMLTANVSAYYRDYFMYQDTDDTEKWSMIPWNMDRTFAESSVDLPYHQSGKEGFATPDNPFLERALINEQIFSDIRDRVDELTGTIFTSDYLGGIIDSLKTVLTASIEEDSTDSVADLTEWESSLEACKNFIGSRYTVLQEQFGSLPRPFHAIRTPEWILENVSLSWTPSVDPNGDAVTYQVSYGTSETFVDSLTTVISDIVETSYDFPILPPHGIYYWHVSASDGSNAVTGYDTRNMFEIEQSTILPSNISGDVVLEKALSPYVTYGNLTVSEGSSLTVEAGVVIRIADNANIFVYGGFEISGTEAEPVYLTSYSSSNTWEALIIETQNVPVMLSHVVIERTAAGIDPEFNNAAISTYSADITLDHVLFREVMSGLSVIEGNLIATNCTFAENNSGEQIHVQFTSSAVIDNCLFYGHNGNDAIDFENVPSGIIRNCTIYSAGDDGIDIGNVSGNIEISNTRIFDANDKGISIGQDSYASITECVIAGAETGIAVLDDAVSMIDHCTIVDNKIAVHCYENETNAGGGTAEITNSILAFSRNETIVYDAASSITISYSLSEQGLLSGEGNIYADPMFADGSAGDYSLLPGSPCINTGNPESAADPDGTRTDIGAIYYAASLIVINEINYNSSTLFDPEDWIELYNPSDIQVDISGWFFKNGDDIHLFEIPDDTIINPDGYLVLCRDEAAFHGVFPGVINYIGDFVFGLSSGGELLRLFNERNGVIDSLTYGIAPPWPGEPDGNGPTLSLINPFLDNTQPGSWAPSHGNGTPGTANDVLVGVDTTDTAGSHGAFSLGSNYPNPFNPSTTFEYTIPVDCNVEFVIYDILGRKVAVLHDGMMSAGIHSAVWNGRDSGGNMVSSGVYLYRFTAGDYLKQGKVMFLR